MVNPVQSLGAYALGRVFSAGRLGMFFIYTIRGIVRPPGKFWPTVKQIEFIGTKSLLVIGFTAAFTGMVLALQGYHTLTKFGSEGWLGSAVGLSLIRELGPVLSALMVTGRAGSATAAEIGIMRIEEQIDALECMAIDPFSYLITPRFIASMVCLPLLTAFCDVVGIFGGFIIGVGLLGVNGGAFWDSLISSVDWGDLYMGLVKSVCFSILIVWVCTYKGFYAGVDEGSFGPEQVGRATTNAVVMASIAVLISDYVITSILL
ncbi:toluene transporter subunit: membrane component of ABC superfamily [Syntrophobacter sp. SbD1]|nr:toluene transporter subunit: membrane component of ABC superfamily [Syntrophobacter sp. SbD1]